MTPKPDAPKPRADERRAGLSRPDQRMMWFLDRLNSVFCRGFTVAWDDRFVDAFVEAFPEAEKTLKVYILGPNSSSLLNAAANRARQRGFVDPGVVGTQDARSFNQRTWARTWALTDAGRAALSRDEERGNGRPSTKPDPEPKGEML